MSSYPPLSQDSGKPFLQATSTKGDPGDPALIAIANPSSLALPCDSDGSNVIYTNADIYVSVISGNIILADESLANGWTMTVDTATNVTATISGLTASITNISADEGSLKLKLSHTNYNDVYVTAKIYKAYKGAQGPQGTQGVKGDTGSQGIQGPQGDPGTGLVVVKKNIIVADPIDVAAVTDNGSGYCRLTFSSDPGLSLGQYLYIIDANGANYDSSAIITNVISTLIIDTDLSYSQDANVDVFDMHHYRKNGTYGSALINPSLYQTLAFPNIVPVGAKLEDLAFIRTGTAGTSQTYLLHNIGYSKYPNAGYNAYVSQWGNSIIGRMKQINLWDTSRSEYTYEFIISLSDNRRNIFVRSQKYSSSAYWNTDLANETWELFVTYRYFNTAYSEA